MHPATFAQHPFSLPCTVAARRPTEAFPFNRFCQAFAAVQVRPSIPCPVAACAMQ